MTVKSTLTSKCLWSTVPSASLLVTNSFHTAPFPITGGDMWIGCPTNSRAVRSSFIYSLQSGCPAIRSSWFLSNDVTIALLRVSYTVGQVISPAWWYSGYSFTRRPDGHTTAALIAPLL
jgi:hypothetical protein